MTVSIEKAADYLCVKLSDAGDPPSILKLHKLLYYAQAWHLAIFDEPLFDEEFEAWVHGPVHRGTFDRFKSKKSMYDVLSEDDFSRSYSGLTTDAIKHLDNILEVYGRLSGTQLEQLTHREDPWLKARGSLEPCEKCTDVISQQSMRDYYRTQMD